MNLRRRRLSTSSKPHTMGFVFHYISNATESLHFTQPAKALKFYNFVCSIEGKCEARCKPLGDNEKDREIISFYVRYHHLLFQNDTTASNALIGAWQKQLGHQRLWEDFSLEYTGGPPSMNENERIHSRRTHASTRKSTGGIPASKSVKRATPIPRRRSEEHHYFSDSSLTPLPSSDDEDDIISDLPADDPNDCSVGSVGQGTSQNDTHQDVNMDSGDEPLPAPPQDIGFLVDSLGCEPTKFAAALTQVVDDPMNGTSVSAACFQSGREPLQSSTCFNDENSPSAPVPRSSTAPYQKKRRRTNWYSKKKPSKKSNRAEATADQLMIIDTPTVAELEPEPESLTVEPVRQDIALNEPFIPNLVSSEPPSLKISIHPHMFMSPIVSEIRVPLATSCVNIRPPHPAQASNPDPLPNDLKGSGDTPGAAVPGFLRPTLSSNPPIWAQVRIFLELNNTDPNVQLVASGALRIL